MKKEKFLKGIQLLALARTKGQELGIDTKNVKMEQLILTIQEHEGNEVCFRKKETCRELACCWQLSCTAKMVDK
jgi:hypothetical protein